MYHLKLWNQKYGRQARFVVFNPATQQYTEYSPYHTNDVVWVNHDITHNPVYETWENWHDEPIQELNDATM